MPRDIPGFFYDSKTDRYFPIRGNVPGTKHKDKVAAWSLVVRKKAIEKNVVFRKNIKATALLQFRELYGKNLQANKCKCNFQQEYQKTQVSQATVWEYADTKFRAESAIVRFDVDVQTPQGQKERNVLVTGSVNGRISYFEIEKHKQQFGHGACHFPDCKWPLIKDHEAKSIKEPLYILNSYEEPFYTSYVSCIRKIIYSGSHQQRALLTSLGTESTGGSVYVLNLNNYLNSLLGGSLRRRFQKIASLKSTIWTADWNINSTKAVLGTDQGAALIDLNYGNLSWICRSKSDIFSQQFDQSGNVVLCGFRNGAIAAVDVRESSRSNPLPRHKIPRPPEICKSDCQNGQTVNEGYFEVRGHLNPTRVISSTSSVCSLVWLRSDDYYFLASSMDGYVKLYDRRLLQNGAVQAYDGYVNTHSSIQLGVDPSESLVATGGEDGFARIWNIKTGEPLFGARISDAIVSSVHWPEDQRSLERESLGRGLWLGSSQAIYYMQSLTNGN